MRPFVGIRIAGLVGLLSACGTLTGLREIAYIESQPPGLTIVRVGDEQVNVLTPALVPVRKSKSFELAFKGAKGDSLVKQEVACDVRWLGAVTPDVMGAAFLSSAGAGLGFLGLDFLTGGLYDCPNAITLPAPKGVQGAPRSCLRYLVISSSTLTEEAMQTWLAKSWKETDCQSFIYNDMLKSDLEYFGLAGAEFITVDSLPEQKWRELAYKYHGNALLFLNVGDGAIRAVSYDLGAFKKKELPSLNLPLQENFVDRSTLGQAKKFLFYLFPNSMTMGAAFDSSSIFPQHTQDDYKVKVTKRGSAFELFNTFGFQTVNHPDAQGDWKILTSLAPSFKMIGQDIRYEAESAKTGETTYHRQRYTFLLPGFGFGVDYFMPIGTLYLNGSIGPALIYVKNDDDVSKAVSSFNVMSVGYRGFMTRNFYSFSQLDRYLIAGSYDKDALVIPMNRTIVTIIGVGLYLPVRAVTGF